MLAAASRRLAERGLSDRVDLVRGEAEALPFADASFDGLTVSYLLRYVTDPAATLRRARPRRAPRPGAGQPRLRRAALAAGARGVAPLHRGAAAGGRAGGGRPALVAGGAVPAREHPRPLPALPAAARCSTSTAPPGCATCASAASAWAAAWSSGGCERVSVGVIAHLDIDAFFAAVEMHRRPELRGRPVVVGGDPHGRGVVATASYAARAFGIRSAMSAAEALRRCPDVVFVRPDIAHYREWSERVWDLVRELSPAVEVLGLDEGYLELPDEGAPEAADGVRRAVAERVRLSCSLGVATCKVVAKVASDRDKPGGVTVVPPGAGGRLPGAAAAARAARRGAAHRGAPRPRRPRRPSATWPPWATTSCAGSCRAGSARTCAAAPAASTRARWPPCRRSGSRSPPRPTFERDLAEPARLEAIGRELADERRRRPAPARPGGPHGDREAALRRLPHRSPAARPCGAAVDDAEAIWTTAAPLLARALRERPGALRLLGVGVSGLSPERQLTLFGAQQLGSRAMSGPPPPRASAWCAWWPPRGRRWRRGPTRSTTSTCSRSPTGTPARTCSSPPSPSRRRPARPRACPGPSAAPPSPARP